MPRGEDGETRARKRVSNACQRCRKHKIKCSGTQPCHTCDQKGIRCEFGAEDRKVVISESILLDLKSRLRQLERQQSQTAASEQRPARQDADIAVTQECAHENNNSTGHYLKQSSVNLPQGNETVSTVLQDPFRHNDGSIDPALSPGNTTESDHHELDNPLVPEQPHFIFDNSVGLSYLGTTSTWSFSRQVLRMAHASPHSNPSSVGSNNIEGDAYKLDMVGPLITPEDIIGLPSMELSLYYLQTVKFRTFPLYHLFDESEFTYHLHCFYERPLAYAKEYSLWFIHFLLVVGFGKAFVASVQSRTGPVGSELFMRALRLLPSVSYLCNDRARATEIFCCVALYFQSIDHRTAAVISIGQAVRMAQSHGLHTNLQVDAVGPEFVLRGRRIWWTVYSLDRKLSCSVGLPSTLRDVDVTAPLPNTTDKGVNATGLAIHVQICQLLGKVINTVYGRDGELKKTFLTTVQTVLRGIAPLANELRIFSERTFGEISRFAANLTLAYHHCILIASRPFLFYILKYRLENTSRPFPLSSSAKGLVQVCIDSAMQIVTTISELKAHDLLDTFLPFDLESLFSAAFVLVMASHVHPKLLPKDDWLSTVMSVFHYLALSGNVLAVQRKSEVDELVSILDSVGHVHHNHPQPGVEVPLIDPPSVAASVPDNTSLLNIGDPFFDEWIANEGLSGAQIMDLADAIQPGGFDNFMLGPFGEINMA